MLQTATHSDQVSFMAYEASVVVQVRQLGKLLLMLFLGVREQRLRAQTPPTVMAQDQSYTLRPAKPRNLSTMFGPIRYWRSYLRGKGGQGFHRLDVELGLTTDRLSMNLLSVASRLATMLCYAKVHTTLCWFLGSAPSTEVIEQTVLGLGRRTAQWFEQTPAPTDDGEVLIIQVDSKGAPPPPIPNCNGGGAEDDKTPIPSRLAIAAELDGHFMGRSPDGKRAISPRMRALQPCW